jgi:hypothetical protein
VKLSDSDGTSNHVVPVSSGLLRDPHVRRIGSSLALFLKLEDMVTSGKGTDGLVFGGQPVTDERLARTLGIHAKTAGKQRRNLQAGGYIECIRSPIGYRITVRKSKKWVWIQCGRRSQNATSGSEMAPGIERTGSRLGTKRYIQSI